MTSSKMGQRYIEEARGRIELVQLARQRSLWATVIREAQECIELSRARCGSWRRGARTHDVAELLRRAAGRFPDWFRTEIDHLAAIPTEMAGDRGLAFYGDERQSIAPQDLFDENDAARALDNLTYVAGLCTRLLDEAPG